MLEIQGTYTVYIVQCTVYIYLYMYMLKGTSAGYSEQRYFGWIIKEGWLTLSPNQTIIKKILEYGVTALCEKSNYTLHTTQ